MKQPTNRAVEMLEKAKIVADKEVNKHLSAGRSVFGRKNNERVFLTRNGEEIVITHCEPTPSSLYEEIKNGSLGSDEVSMIFYEQEQLSCTKHKPWYVPTKIWNWLFK